jgi:transglutaminase-like putative cysteine protease
MTATLTPPAPTPAEPEPTASGAPASPAARHLTHPRSLLPVAELALVLVTLTTALSFGRVYDDKSFLGPLALVAVAAHAVTTGLRRAGRPVGLSAIVSAVAGILVITWVLYPYTTNHGLPTGRTFAAGRHDLATAWQAFRIVVSPTPPLRGFLLATAVALWATAFVSDWAAFRLWVPFESIIPAGTLFLFASMFGADDHRSVYAFLFALAVITFLLLHRVARQQASTAWVAADSTRGTVSLLKVGAALGAIALLAAAVVGPLLPGAHATELFAWRDLDKGPPSRQTVSPLVQIRGRLTNQSAAEVFTVSSPERSYWRLTALDDFDGDVWSSKGSYGDANGHLPVAVPTDAQTDVVEQQYTISGLSAIWLPAAFEPRGVSGNVDARYEPNSSTLIVDTTQPNSDGLVYTVQSAIPHFALAALEAAPAGVPRTIASRDLKLPGDFPNRVRDLAERVTRGARTPYAKAIALQTYFRRNFSYSLDAPAGHSDTAIESFLFDTRVGYCEQFAGSYAAMARAIGLPARVAVGFTPGELGSDSLYHVRGEHAHAWPEVYITGAGWVPFEPTPGRGAPGAEGYTGVAEQQAETGNPGVATTVPSSATTLHDDGGPTVPSSLDLPGSDPGQIQSVDPVHAPSPASRFVRTWAPWVGVALLVLFGLAILFAAAMPAYRYLRRRRRRHRAATPEDRVRVAWAEGVEAVSPVGLSPHVTETHAEFAARAGKVVAPEEYADLAGTAQAAEYSVSGVDADDADRALAISRDIRGAARARATPAQRAKAALDPRDLLPGLRRTSRQRVDAAERDDQERIEPVRASR